MSELTGRANIPAVSLVNEGGRGVCEISGCGRPTALNGAMCHAHEDRKRRGLDMSKPIRNSTAPDCKIPDCERISDTDGMCSAHYQRWKKGARGDDLNAPIKSIAPRKNPKITDTPCLNDWCDRESATVAGLCKRCQTRSRLNITGPPRNSRVRGTSNPLDPLTWPKGIDGNGYVSMDAQIDGVRMFALEHRVIMEQKVGRKLLAHENVHHINGVKTDNRIENLELWVTSQPRGQLVTDLLEWAHEILDTYGGGRIGEWESGCV